MKINGEEKHVEFMTTTRIYGLVTYYRASGLWYLQHRTRGPLSRVDEDQVPEIVLEAWRKSCAAPLKPGS